MRVITEHTAIDVGHNLIEINYPGIIISAKEKNNELVIYAIEDLEETKIERSVYVALTGEEPADPRFTFIDTVLVEGFQKMSIAFHVFADNPI